MGTFGTDQVLLYNVAPWSELGFGVPNFGDNPATQNMPVNRLVNEIGVIQLSIMTHIDAARRQYPSINTIRRLGTILNRIKSVLINRATPATQTRLEPGHGMPSAEFWTLHPVPYFNGPIVKNSWLKEYNALTMVALTNMMQHSDNNLALTITAEFAQDVWGYFREMRRLIAGELLGLTSDVYDTEEFLFTEEQYKLYNPAQNLVRIEALDDPGNVLERFTEDDLKQFVTGIPANIIVPNLAKYPTTKYDSYSGAQNTTSTPTNPAPGTAGGVALQPLG